LWRRSASTSPLPDRQVNNDASINVSHKE